MSCSAWPSADGPASRTEVTRATPARAAASRVMAAWSAAVRAPAGRAATTVTAVSEAPCSGEASWAARSLGALAGRNVVLSLWVTADSDGRATMAAARPASQAATMTQRKRTAIRPAAAKNVPAKAIVAGHSTGRKRITSDPLARKVTS